MEVDEIKKVRESKLEALKQSGIRAYGSKFIVTDKIANILEKFEEGKKVSIAGRLMANRSHGKVLFGDLEDQTGRMQLFIKLDEPESRLSKICTALDIGDIIGVEGELFVTKTRQNKFPLCPN